MEGADTENEPFEFPIFDTVEFDIAEPSNIIEEGPRVCPLCNSLVRPYFLNLREQLLMCENKECEYPIGYEDLHIIKLTVDSSEDEDEDLNSMSSSKVVMSGSGSIVSAVVMAEIEKLNNVSDSEDSQLEARLVSGNSERERNEELIKEKEEEERLMNSVRNIRNLNMELMKETETESPTLDDENLIKNLWDLQGAFGCKLLKEKEISKLKKKQPYKGRREVKIDLGDSSDKVSSITIEITNKKSEAC